MSRSEELCRQLHLSEEQRAILVEFRDSFANRPSFNDYERFQQKMKAVDPQRKPKQKEIPHTLPGHDRGDIKLQEQFDARTDLPLGWGVYSHHDSGGNFGIRSAGQLVLTALWNFWDFQDSWGDIYGIGPKAS